MTQAWEAGVSAGTNAAAGTSLYPMVLSTTSQSPAQAGITPREAILLNMQRNGIDVGAMLRDRFKARIAQEKLFVVVADEAGADATIELRGGQWGVSLVNFSKELYPTMGVVAVMRRGDEQIWRNFETITAMSAGNDKAFTPERYAADPEALRSAFNRAIDLLTGKLMADLKQ
ncbi:hypothetical protein PSCICO_09480 [Pseudomonas cichorii]|nr:hypothetical protein PSCICO_09480 [Pseudomonas cichorii]